MADIKSSGGTDKSVVLIGCGKIGSLWDEGQPLDSPALTHAHAVQKSPGLRLAALCDSDGKRLGEAAAKRRVSAVFSNIGEALMVSPDIVVLATSTSMRLSALEAIAKSPAKILVLEKPMASTLKEARQINDLLRAGKMTTLVNYLRRWDPAIRHLREEIVVGGEFGELQRAIGVYNKGLCNNGSHQIDLMRFIFGNPVKTKSLGLNINEGAPLNGDDLSLDAEIVFKTGSGFASFIMAATDFRAYTVFELDLFFTKGRVRISDSGREIEKWKVEANQGLIGYNRLAKVASLKGGLTNALECLYVEVLQQSRGSIEAVSCGLEDGLMAVAVVEAIRDSENKDQKFVEIEKIEGVK
jgi:predicted dehydrogenase